MPHLELSSQLFEAVVALIKLMISGYLEENQYYMAKNKNPTINSVLYSICVPVPVWT